MANKYWLGTGSNPVDLSETDNWSGGALPVAGDNVHFPSNSPQTGITAGLTALNTATLSGALGAVVFEPGWNAPVGAFGGSNLQFTCSRFEYNATGGQAFIDLQASAIAPRIYSTGPISNGQYGLYLIGSALTTINIMGGVVAIAGQFSQTAAATTINILGGTAQVFVGIGCTLVNVYCVAGGPHEIHCATSYVTVLGGTLFTKEVGAIGNQLTIYGGAVYPESSGAIAEIIFQGPTGTVDMTSSTVARTVTLLYFATAGGTFIFDPDYITVTGMSVPGGAMSIATTYPY